jgi:hypothetical protein
MPTSSVFDHFEIRDDETLKKLLKEKPEEEKRKTPKIDIQKRIDEGKKVLDTF